MTKRFAARTQIIVAAVARKSGSRHTRKPMKLCAACRSSNRHQPRSAASTIAINRGDQRRLEPPSNTDQQQATLSANRNSYQAIACATIQDGHDKYADMGYTLTTG